jgi:hypothetical protein
MTLKEFPTFLLSADLIALISFAEYCSNVRLVLEIEVKLVIEKVTFAAFCGELNDITKSLSVIFQSEGYDILKPSIGFSTVKKCFGSNVAVVDASDAPLSINANNNNGNRIAINSRCLIGWKYILLFMAQIIITFTIR